MASPRIPKLAGSYDELIAGYYGRHHRKHHHDHHHPGHDRDGRGQGETPEAAIGSNGGTARVLSLTRDDGEILTQSRGHDHGDPVGGGWDDVDNRFESHRHHHPEYVVDMPSSALYAVSPVAAAPPSPAPAAPPPAPSAAAPAEPTASTPGPGVQTPNAMALTAQALNSPSATAPPSAAPPPAPPLSSPTSSSVDEHELAADLQAILAGASVYDPASGRTVPRDQLGVAPASGGPSARPRSADAQGDTAGQPTPGNAHAIFDAIAESMQYANTYDLGTIDLDGRFDDFDRISDLEEQRRSRPRDEGGYDDIGERRRRPAIDEYDNPGASGAGAGSADFLNDMDAIRSAAEDRAHDGLRIAADAIGKGMARQACLGTAVELVASAKADIEQALYDTGEHVLAADGIYSQPLVVGASPGVSFSYAQLVTMADLYDRVEDLLAADPAELGRLKALIEQDAAHYRDGSARDVSDKEWNDATGGRYLDVAERNHAHFAPDVLFNDAIANAGAPHSNHREAWEAHHRRALAEARGASGDPPAHALIINAFGDHFLTDAFSAGHLINKDAVSNYFKHNFLSGGKLTSAGNAFFDRVAKKAFAGQVKEKFSRLETAHWPAWYIPFHPNIDSPDRFASLLKAACEAQPDKVSNLAVKAVHDYLNNNGIEVTSNAGSVPWKLTGDGHLTAETCAIMKQAVRASVSNLTDPALRTAGDATCFERVWRFTPVLTASSRPTVIALVNDFTNPASTRLSDAAAGLITKQVDQLIHVLVDQQHQLRPA
jgi:hypothetical protein